MDSEVTLGSVRPQNIDGFFRGRSSERNELASLMVNARPKVVGRPVNHLRAHAPKLVAPIASHSVRVHTAPPENETIVVRRTPTAANHARAHTLQKSRTLMRSYVKRPEPRIRTRISSQSPSTIKHEVPQLIVPKKLADQISVERLERAKATPKSELISHHSSLTAKSPFISSSDSLAVPPAPTDNNQPPVTSSAPPVAPPPMPTNKPTDIFEHALMNAENFVDLALHKKQLKKKARMHFASLAAGTLALLIVAGFAVYQNTPGLQFKVASIRAGVSTSMPDFAAVGFSYKGVSVDSGKLVIGFSKGSDNYQLTQQSTNMSGPDMIASVGGVYADGKPAYKTFQVNHTDIYQFNSSSATWVADGKWYTVSGDLTQAQLAALVQHV